MIRAIGGGAGRGLSVRAATLVGPRDALDVGSNSHLTVAQSQLQGAKKLGSNSSIDDR